MRLPLGGRPRRSQIDTTSSKACVMRMSVCMMSVRQCIATHLQASFDALAYIQPRVASSYFLCHLPPKFFPFSSPVSLFLSVIGCLSLHRRHLHALSALRWCLSIFVPVCRRCNLSEALCRDGMFRCLLLTPSFLWRSFCCDQRVQTLRHYSLILIDDVSGRWRSRSPFIWEECLS